jgi:hypothetical protein
LKTNPRLPYTYTPNPPAELIDFSALPSNGARMGVPWGAMMSFP